MSEQGIWNLNGKTAIVCGGSQGIGLACAQAMADLGASLILVARDADKLQAATAQLSRDAGQTHRHLVADFADVQLVQKGIARLLGEHPTVHILVNNTGGPPAGSALDASLEQFRQAFNNHLLCNQVLVQAVVPVMRQLGYGRIINIISTSVKQPIPGLGVSNTIRAAVANWAKTLASELGPYGITVNNVLPGMTETSRLQSLITTKAAQAQRPVSEIEQTMKDEIPLRRFATPAEIAAAVAFLASPAASYINGINLPVDGGRTQSL